MRILVTGATGYIGGRLIPILLERGHEVVVLVRDARRIARRPWASHVEVVERDLLAGDPLAAPSLRVDAAYYLVHSMYAGSGFADRDRVAAEHFLRLVEGARLVVYLGGLLPTGSGASTHLGSRAEVGAVLRAAAPTTEFRAGPIIGSGSASFEMVRYLTERLPVMVAPRWIRNAVQPIAVGDVLHYLVAALEHGPLGIVDVGGPALTFKQMMLDYAAVRGLRRAILPVPVLAPALAARWVGLVTPLTNRIAIPLIEGIVQPVVADTRLAQRHFPEVVPVSYKEAVATAFERTTEGAETAWSGALSSVAADEEDLSGSAHLSDQEGVIREVRTLHARATDARVFGVVSSLGGARGWLAWNWAWEARGLLDRVVGGPGLRRGRRHPRTLFPGEAVDFWRVDASDPPHLLRLRAEMKVPGRAWLQWTIAPAEGGSTVVQTALFAPRGLAGVLYWYALYPMHALIFSAMARAVVRAAEGAGD